MNIVKLNLYKTELFVYRRYNVDVSLTLNEETARKILTMCTIHALVHLHNNWSVQHTPTTKGWTR